MSRLLYAGDALLGWRARLSGRIEVGPESRVEWRNLRVTPGNRLRIGRNSIFGATVSFESRGGEINVGDRTFVGRSRLLCHTRIDIGSDVIMSWGITVVDHNSHALSWTDRADDVTNWAKGKKIWDNVKRAPVRISDRAWIGFNVIILKGVTIGYGAVIGAGAVVTKDVPPFSVAAGNPARVIRDLGADER